MHLKDSVRTPTGIPRVAPSPLTYAKADDCEGGEDLQPHQQRAVQDLHTGQEVRAA